MASMDISKRQNYINSLDETILSPLRMTDGKPLNLEQLYVEVKGYLPYVGAKEFFTALGFLVKRDYVMILDSRHWTMVITDDGHRYCDYIADLSRQRVGR